MPGPGAVSCVNDVSIAREERYREQKRASELGRESFGDQSQRRDASHTAFLGLNASKAEKSGAGRPRKRVLRFKTAHVFYKHNLRGITKLLSGSNKSCPMNY